ncbi:MAG TPA: gluconate 2-dehydrogenase subunit 3 family protein [Bryobacteraceae bacterium]|nr:gluconate 2-dehydrogenase subunit 3 family protein [Bryobacteraceae bacterium]
MNKVTRRTVIASATLAPVAAIRSAAQPTALSPAQLSLLEAIVDRLIPADDLGPGAKECGAANFIDRSLTTEKASFIEGLAAVDAQAQTKFSRAFVELSAADREAVLESSPRPFFNRVRQLTIEGTFSDPSYGGNRGYMGWDLIRYPGPRMAVKPEDQKLRDAAKPVRTSGAHGH